MNPPIGPQRPPIGNPAVDLDLQSVDRTQAAVIYVERLIRGGKPTLGRGNRTWTNPGVYAITTTAITGASGLTLGFGSAQLCSRSTTSLTADGEVVTVYNAGGPVGSGVVLSLGSVDGDWSTSVTPC